MGYDPLGASAEQHTVPAVFDEIRDRSAKIRMQTARDAGVLKVSQPSEESKERVILQSTQLGDIAELSVADRDVLALALDLAASGKECSLVTDDHAVQNIAHGMGIPFRPLATPGIKYQFLWRQYCPACGRAYPSGFRASNCTVCGTRLRRRVSKKRKVSES